MRCARDAGQMSVCYNYSVMNLIFLFALSMLLSALLTFGLIIILKFFRIGQSIREEGPEAHKKKSGTPTMGGIAFLLSILIMLFIFVDIDGEMISLILMMLGFAAIGFVDDFIKVTRSRNQGFLPWQKMGLQIVLALVFGSYLLFNFHDLTVTGVLKMIWFNQPWLYLPFICFIIVGATTAANLTDGLDGLLAGTAAIAFIVFALIASRLVSYDVMGLCAVTAGSLAGFLIFNFNPAKIFMGDAGSLSLGALLAGVAILLHKELLLLLIGGVFVIETLSVILQVSYFKVSGGKRLFKMAPIHHHFELAGMKERNVVLMFWAAAAGMGIVAVLIR